MKMQKKIYKLFLTEIKNTEIIHHADDGCVVSSKFNTISINQNGRKTAFCLPLPLYLRVIGVFRLTRRILRIDKSSIALSKDRSSLVITYGGGIYKYCFETNKITKTGMLEQCRCVLHMSIASIDQKTFILGEYGRNTNRESVPIHMSTDGGVTWTKPFLFPKKTIRHIHGIYHDPFTDNIWVPTGDFSNECYLYQFANTGFTNPTIHGDGTQIWRTVSLFFTKKSIVWIMDSELDTSHLIIMDRKTGIITKGRAFPGPVWYIKTLSDGWNIIQTTVENGAGVTSNNVHLFASKDLHNWEEIGYYPHDGLPLRYCKNAVVAFANGRQSIDNFYISAEAIKGMDGKAYLCKIKESTTNDSET